MQNRDELELGRRLSNDEHMMNTVATADARFEAATVKDSRFAEHFFAEAGTGWWWRRPVTTSAPRLLFCAVAHGQTEATTGAPC
jgi:hypothetical protein